MAQAQKMTKSALFAFFADKFEVKRTEVRAPDDGPKLRTPHPYRRPASPSAESLRPTRIRSA